MPRDPAKARARKKRYLERRKIAKYGPGAAGVSMTGRHGNHARGAENGKWNSGRMLSSHGYVLIRVSKSQHPRAYGAGYAYEHDLVMAKSIGRALGNDEIVHHKNGDKTDNRIENLELQTRRQHALHHSTERGRDPLGRFPGKAAR